jgi:hypothetical protein
MRTPGPCLVSGLVNGLVSGHRTERIATSPVCTLKEVGNGQTSLT